MAQIAVGVRLATYGLKEADVKLTDLRLNSGEQKVLSPADPALKSVVRSLVPTGIDELKKWLAYPGAQGAAAPGPVVRAGGVSAAGAGMVARSRLLDYHSIADIVHPLPAVLTQAHTAALYAAAQQYVYGNAKTMEPQVVSNLDTWVRQMKPTIPIFLYQDIDVGPGAKLVVKSSNSILFARHITVEKTGQIVARVSVAKIDCAGLKGSATVIRRPVVQPVVHP